MGENNEKENEVRGTRERRDNDSPSIGSPGTGCNGGDVEIVGAVGTGSQNWARTSLLRNLAGGVVSQLITQIEDQLGEARETIAKEERKIEKLNQRLLQLRRLQESEKTEQ